MGSSENAAPAVAALAREVEEFVAAGGWDQQPQLFALVPTAALLREQPDLAGQLDTASALTPVAQEALPEGDLAEALGRIMWPAAVAGCALAQEMLLFPTCTENDLTTRVKAKVHQPCRAAADHPDRTEARLVAAVLRDGPGACVLRLRAHQHSSSGSPADEIVEHPDFAPNLLEALRATLTPEPPD